MATKDVVRTRGVTIFAVVAIILGSWNALISGSGVVILSLPSFIKEVQLPEAGPMWAGTRILFCINFTLAILLLVSGISILKLKIWGRVTIIIQSILSLSYNLYFLVGWIMGAYKVGIAQLSQFWPIGGTLFMMAFAILVLWFFNRTLVKAQFQK